MIREERSRTDVRRACLCFWLIMHSPWIFVNILPHCQHSSSVLGEGMDHHDWMPSWDVPATTVATIYAHFSDQRVVAELPIPDLRPE
jgi:hypothetical protein